MYIAIIYGECTNGSSEKRKCITDILILEKKQNRFGNGWSFDSVTDIIYLQSDRI